MHTYPVKETVVWLALMALTLLSYFAWDGTLTNAKSSSALILLAAGFKFSAIGYYFMELEESHLIWKAAMLFFLIVMFGGISLLL